MTTKQMNDLVDRYLDSKGLSNPSIRKRAARKVLGYMDTTGAFLSGGQLALPSDKGVVVSAYKRHKGSALNGAEKKLLQGEFVSVGALSGEMVPDVPGCIASSSVKVSAYRQSMGRSVRMASSISARHPLPSESVSGNRN